MTDPSDDEILARIAASQRVMWRLVWTLLGGLGLIVAVVAALVFTGHAAWQQNVWFQAGVAAVMVALFLYVIVMMGRHFVPPEAAMGPTFARRRIDAHQRRWRWALLSNLLVGLFLAYNQWHALNDFAALGDDRMRLLLGLGFGLYPLLMVAILTVGPRWQSLGQLELAKWVDDEFSLALRARTLRVGYVFAMVLLAAVFVVTLWRPALTLTVLCWGLFAGAAVPTLYYVIADWRAGREE